MPDAVIVDAVRTPIDKGKPGGALTSSHPTDLLARTPRPRHARPRGARWGLQTMCEAGGLANATVVERL
jgi:acetyl-CoA acetyltransferase